MVVICRQLCLRTQLPVSSQIVHDVHGIQIRPLLIAGYRHGFCINLCFIVCRRIAVFVDQIERSALGRRHVGGIGFPVVERAELRCGACCVFAPADPLVGELVLGDALADAERRGVEFLAQNAAIRVVLAVAGLALELQRLGVAIANDLILIVDIDDLDRQRNFALRYVRSRDGRLGRIAGLRLLLLRRYVVLDPVGDGSCACIVGEINDAARHTAADGEVPVADNLTQTSISACGERRQLLKRVGLRFDPGAALRNCVRADLIRLAADDVEHSDLD